MNFGLSEEQELLQKTVADFAAKECPPPRVREIFDAEEGHDAALWNGLCELGIAGLIVPEPYGGAGLEMVDLALVAETLGHGGVPGPFFGHALASIAITLGGSDAQKERWLPGLASGEQLGTVALDEAGGGWQPDAWTAAVTGGAVSGEKQFVPSGAVADLIVVGTAGGGLAVVERKASGVKLAPVSSMDRTRRFDALTLENAPCEELDAGVTRRVLDAGLILLAADAFGVGSRLLEMAVDYAKTREQFGVTIAHFQAVKHKLADMAVELEPSRGLWWYAAHAWDALPDEAERAAALAKAHVTDRAMGLARDTVELHGGIGFTWECDVQIWFKRAMFDRAVLGMPSLHRERSAQLAGW